VCPSPYFVCAAELFASLTTQMASRRARVKVAPKLLPGRRVAGQAQASSSSTKNSQIALEQVTLSRTQVKQPPVEEACSLVAEAESSKAQNSGPTSEGNETLAVSEFSPSMNAVTEPPQAESNLEAPTKNSTSISPGASSTKPPSAPVRASRLRGRVKAAPKLIPGRRLLNGEARDATVQYTRIKSSNTQLQPSTTPLSAPDIENKSNNSNSGHEPHLGDMTLVSLNQPDIPPDSDWEDDQFTYNSVEVEPSKLTPELTNLISSASVSLGEDTSVSLVENPICTGTTAVSLGENSAAVGENTPALPSASPMSPKLPRALSKNRFKPNLFTDRRSRNVSGGTRPSLASPRARTISGSGTDSETEAPGSPARRTPVLERLLSQAKPARVRRGTECEMTKERSQFMRRKQEHKRRFLKGVPERGRMTMFDLIYYNPENGPRMSIEEEDKADSPEDLTEQAENTVDAEQDPPAPSSPPSQEPGDGVPCPQVKLGANGEIILDDTSLVLETTDAKKAKDFLDNSPVAIIESGKTTATNYGTWSRKRKHVDWSEKETLRFYKALSIVGSDFSMMESIFKKRTRQELKLKFKKEERLNGKMVDKCLRERGMYTELEGVMEDSEQDSDVEERGRKKIAKKRPRRRYRNHGYYDSSSGGEDADGEASLSPAKKRQRDAVVRPTNNRRAQNPAPVTPAPQPVPATPAPKPAPQAAAAAATQLATALGGVQFPPGLLAANPGLVGARPGSLVVVASPSKTDPGSQLLHVYMVSSRQKGEEGSAAGGSRERSRSPRVAHSSSPRSPSPRLTLDPAVVRAVDRSRLAEREGTSQVRHDRSRATSECEDALVNTRARLGARQRTCSEGSGGDLRTELVRQRFLSGAVRSVPGPNVGNRGSTNSSLGTPEALVSCLNLEQSSSLLASGLPVAKKSHPSAPSTCTPSSLQAPDR